MGRGRGKGKKQTVIASHEDPGNGEEEKFPAYKRRGRLVKPFKDDNEEEEAAEINEDGKDVQDSISNKDAKSLASSENGQKRKRPGHTKENTDSIKEENDGVRTKLSVDNSTVSSGFPRNGNRRKNKPRRAAEAVIECM